MRCHLLPLILLLAMPRKVSAEDEGISVIVSIVANNATSQSFVDNVDPQYGEEYIHSAGMRAVVPWTGKWHGILVDFGNGCRNTTNASTIYALNNNFSRFSDNAAFQLTPKVAFIYRAGPCLWSEKVLNAQSIAANSNISLSGVIIYDLITGPINTNMSVYLGSLYPNDNISPSGSSSLPNNNRTFPNTIFFPYPHTLLSQLNFTHYANSLGAWPPLYVRLTVEYTQDSSDAGLGASQKLGVITIVATVLIPFLSVFILYLRYVRQYGWNPVGWPSRSEQRWQRRQHQRQRRRSRHVFGMGDDMSLVHLVEVKVLNRAMIDIVLPPEPYDPKKVKNSTCAICLDDLDGGEGADPKGIRTVRRLACEHGFCLGCVDEWLTTKSTLCPICKRDCVPSGASRKADTQTSQTSQRTIEESEPATATTSAPALAIDIEAEEEQGEASGTATTTVAEAKVMDSRIA